MTLVIVAFAMMLLLGVAGMAIDMGYLYCARVEAQRAADAAALAAAQDFVSSGYTSGLVNSSQAETSAANVAASVGNSNYVIGQSANIDANGFATSCPPPAGSDGCFDMSTANDPRVTVVVQRTALRGDPVKLYFMSLFGLRSADVSTSATAEAYTPSAGNGPPVTVQSLKPWLVANCDPNSAHAVPAGDPRANPNCPLSNGEYASYYVYPSTSAYASAIVNPGGSGGVIGQKITLRPGSPQQAPAPSQFFSLYLPYSDLGTCPACAATSTSSDGPSSGSLYEDNIECQTRWMVTCGQTPIQLAVGNMVGPTGSGVDCLIHEDNGVGQDTLNTELTPFQMLAGSANPYFPEGTQISTSDSIAAVPLYDGKTICPGGSCNTSVDVQGFLQLFLIQEGSPQASVTAYILNVAGCGQQSDATPIPAQAGSLPIIVRLIHN